MKTNKDIEMLSERMDSIEKLLKMLVVNSLLDEMNNSDGFETEDGEMIVSDDFEELISEYEMTAIKLETLNEYTLVYIKPSNNIKYKSKDYQILNVQLKSIFVQMIPVFCFESLNGMQRKRFVEEDISFYIEDKEIHICSRNV